MEKGINKRNLLKDEAFRKNIGNWGFIIFVVIGIYLYLHFNAGKLFFDISIAILSGNILLIVTLAIKEFKNKLNNFNKDYFNNIKEEIQNSIKKELKISFSDIKDKIEEYENRQELYEQFNTRNNLNLIKIILISLFLSVGYIVFYSVLNENINQIFSIGTITIYLVDLILIFVFLYSLHLFLSAILYIAISLSYR